jgi:hypothetical protein
MRIAFQRSVWPGLILGTVVAFAPFGAIAADAAAPTPSLSPPHALMSDAQWASLFDQSKPLADRERMLAQVEQSPDLRNPKDLYALGSLYHMGKNAPGSPVDDNPQKASLYLGNAAIRGSVYAMAKMAELKLAAGQYQEAMNWAQIYSHYALLAPETSHSPRESYAAELVSRIKSHVTDTQMAATMKDVNSFVALNDAQIRAGMQADALNDGDRPNRLMHHRVQLPDSRRPDTGIADYLIAFKPDGSAANVQLVDAVPRPEVGGTLRNWAKSVTLQPAPEGNALRYAWVPMVIGNKDYHMDDSH